MTKLRYEGAEYEMRPGETVLEGCERVGIAVSSSCRVGSCQSCLMRATSGAIPARSQAGLRPTLRVRGYFLPCVCTPTEDLAIAAADEGLSTEVVLESRERLSSTVVRLRFRPAIPFEYRAGQFVSFFRDDGLVRSYSLASLPDDPWLEIHVREVPNGAMSTFLSRKVHVGDRLRIRGPAGECFYVDGDPDAPLLLLGTGTGLAPLVGVLRDALRHGHRGPISIVHGARDPRGLYLVDELRAFDREHRNVQYRASVLEGEPASDLFVEPLEATLARLHPSLAGHRVVLAGDPEIVQRLRRKAFLAGASMNAIVADEFVVARPAAPEPVAVSP